jgi:CRP-like cAMP-binding protein
MNMKPVASSPSGNHDTQADVFFAAFLGERQNNLYYRNHLQLYPAKAVIVKQDTPSNAVFLIEQGLVKIVRVTPKGNKVIIGLRYRDWLIGTPTVLLDRPYNFTVIAVVPTLLHEIPKKVFLDHIKKNAEFSWHIHHQLSQQVFDQMKKIEAMSCLAAEDRLERLLIDMVREMGPHESGTPDGFSVPFTNQELAELLVITPEHLCRVLKEMEHKGLVRRDNGTLIVADPAGLLQKAVV